MIPIEFFQANATVFVSSPGGKISEMDESDTDLIDFMYDCIATDYPTAYCVLVDEHSPSLKNTRHFRYLVVDHFVRCNFGRVDNLADVSPNGDFNLEFVDCPMRGHCRLEHVVCLPRRATVLSTAEMRVAYWLHKGKNRQEIADLLYLSPYTVDGHIQHIYKKLGAHSEGDFMRIVNTKKIFENYEVH